MGIRTLVICVGIAAAMSASAQTTATSALDSAVGWLSSQWQRVQSEGRPAAERIVREFPSRFKDMSGQVARITKLASGFSDANHLEEKKTLLLELWRVRGSLNLLALLSPDMLHQMTGMDIKTLTSLQAQLNLVRNRLISTK